MFALSPWLGKTHFKSSNQGYCFHRVSCKCLNLAYVWKHFDFVCSFILFSLPFLVVNLIVYRLYWYYRNTSDIFMCLILIARVFNRAWTFSGTIRLYWSFMNEGEKSLFSFLYMKVLTTTTKCSSLCEKFFFSRKTLFYLTFCET